MSDIKRVHQDIVDSLTKQSERVPALKLRIEELQRRLSEAQSTVLRRRLNNELENLQDQLAKLTNGFALSQYHLKTKAILARYDELIQTKRSVSFSRQGQGLRKAQDAAVQQEKDKLIHAFWQVAVEHGFSIPESVATTNNMQIQEPECSCKTTANHVQDESVVACTECGEEFDVFSQQSSFKDIHRVNMSTKYKYDRAAHFRDAVMQFQGKQTREIPAQVILDLEHEFKKHNLLHTDTNDVYEQHRSISRKHILKFLEETKHNKYYEDSHLLLHKFTNRSPANINDLEQQLYDDFACVLSAYESLANVERLNFLSNQYVLFQLLRRHKFKCKRDDFNIIDSPDRVREHDAIYQRICEQLKWHFAPLQ